MAYSKTILLVVFAVLLITAEVSAHRDLLEKTTPTTDGRSGYNRGGNGVYSRGQGGNGGGPGGHESPGSYERGSGGRNGGNGGGNGGNGSYENGRKGGRGGRGGHGPETQN